MLQRNTQSHVADNQRSSLLINLLPPEIILFRKQSTRISFINKASIVVLLILIFLTSTTVVLRVLQNKNLQEVDNQIVFAQSKINSLKDREGYAIALKSRVSSIASIGENSKQTAIFNLVTSLAPVEVDTQSISVERNGLMVFSANSPSLSALQSFLTNLSSKEKNSDLISTVALESMSKGRDNIYRVSFRIVPK